MSIINKTAVNTVEHVFLLHIGASSGFMPRSGIARSSGNTMSNFLRTHQTDSQSGCTSLKSHLQWRSVPLPPHPHQHLISPEFLDLAILSVVRWNLRVVLISISLMTKHVEHFSVPIPCRFFFFVFVFVFYYYNCSVIQVEVRKGGSTRISFIVENSFHYPSFFVIPKEFSICSFFWDKPNLVLQEARKYQAVHLLPLC